MEMYLNEVQRVKFYKRMHAYYLKQMKEAYDENSYRAFEAKAMDYLMLIEQYHKAV